jgi:hypothetical protein
MRPTDESSRPEWGHAQGLRVGLAPLPGPHGLLRIYAPYLGQPQDRVINYIAVEPTPRGKSSRGLSELEYSKLDSRRGKRFWSGNDADGVNVQAPSIPAAGWLEQVEGVECLRVFIQIEPFDNGAHVYLRLTFRAGRPHEVGLATFAHADSSPLDTCIVTATMGNYARLRRLQLAKRTMTPGELWPSFRGPQFTPHACFALNELERTTAGAALAVAESDEPHPADAKYAPETRRSWGYVGQPASQSWRIDNPPPELKACVNGRLKYWNSSASVPGGLAFENFEFVAPFRQGQEYWFGVKPSPAKKSATQE